MSYTTSKFIRWETAEDKHACSHFGSQILAEYLSFDSRKSTSKLITSLGIATKVNGRTAKPRDTEKIDRR